jgi:hypothetical protein
VSPPAPGSCPCSFFDDSVLPGIQEIRDGVPLTLGIRFSSTADGTVTGVRFYKSAGNTGTHTGTLFTAAGQQLAIVTFANESTAGWQTAYFNQPVAMTANTEYIVAYKTTTGTYSATVNGFGAGLSVGNLRASSDAGAYSYSNDFPNVRSSASYLVDVVVQYPEPAFVAGAQTPLPGSSSVALNTTVSATFSKPATASSVQFTLTGPGGNVPGAMSFDSASGKATFTPSAQLSANTAYTANLTATSTTGQALSAGGTWTFTTVPPPRTDGTCPCTLYQDTVTPTTMEIKDGVPLALGVRFASSASGQVTGIRFYKAAGNTGTHTGSLFSITGQLLATVTFTAESTAGWQTATFSQPVAIAADTEYVAAYKSPTGTYSATPGGFTSGFTSGPLRTAPDSGGFSYSGDFPGSASSASYLVDLVFQTSAVAPPPPPAPAPLTVTAQSPAPNATGVALNVQPSLTLSSAVQPGASLVLAAGGTNIAGTSALSADGRTVTFSPAQQLPANTILTASANNVTSTAGAALAPTSWQFTTVNPPPPPQSMFAALLPQVAATTDIRAIEVGVAFKSSVAGSVTGIRFYKSLSNLGTHTGSLWTTSGVRLAKVTFTNETATGWQTATLPTPIALTAGTNYIVSYNAPAGRYSYTPNFFSKAWNSGVLTARANNNGLYRFGSGTSVPNLSSNATNYFVDVVFAPK